MLLLPSCRPALVFGFLFGFSLGYQLFQGRYRWSFIDGIPKGCNYVLDVVAFVLGCRPAGRNGDDVAGAKRRIGIMDEVVLRVGKPLRGVQRSVMCRLSPYQLESPLLEDEPC